MVNLKSEVRWIVLFTIIEIIWVTILSSTLYQWIYGSKISYYSSVNFLVVTIPMISFVLIYYATLIFTFSVYIIAIERVKNSQINSVLETRKAKRHCEPLADTDHTMRNSITNKNDKPDPLCSIIIPASNEQYVIKKTVINCLKQTYTNIEIIVICHNCTDRTFEEASITDERVKVFNLGTKEAGKGIALNYGTVKSKGDLVLILDADGKLSEDFIEMSLPLLKKDIVAVQGAYVPSNRDYNLLTRLLAIEGDLWSTPFMTTRSILQKRVYLGGTGYIIRKNVLVQVGGFANHLVDDYELSCRLFKFGHKIDFAPLSINYDEKPADFRVMLRQRARWSRGFFNLLNKRAVKFTDILGLLYWLNPVAAIIGISIISIYGYAALHGLVMGHYPFSFFSLPINVWIPMTVTVFIMQIAVLVKEYGFKGLNYGAYLVLYNAFSLYFLVTFIKGLFVKSWGNTKTIHGFSKDKNTTL